MRPMLAERLGAARAQAELNPRASPCLLFPLAALLAAVALATERAASAVAALAIAPPGAVAR